MSRKILVVDDEPAIVEVITARLKAANYEILGASDGRGIVEKAINFAPDLILMDISMPHVDGIESRNALKDNEKTKDIPVIFLTALKTKSDEVDQGFKNADNMVIAKPFDAKQLLQIIEDTINDKK